jgi:hypothetical protein
MNTHVSLYHFIGKIYNIGASGHSCHSYTYYTVTPKSNTADPFVLSVSPRKNCLF